MNRHNEQAHGRLKNGFHPAVVTLSLNSMFAGTATSTPVIINGNIDGSVSEKNTRTPEPIDIKEFRRRYLADADEKKMQGLFETDMRQEVLDKNISKIKYYRIIRGLTQNALAEKLGMQQPNMARVEKVGYPADLQTLKKLAKIFKIDYKELLD